MAFLCEVCGRHLSRLAHWYGNGNCRACLRAFRNSQKIRRKLAEEPSLEPCSPPVVACPVGPVPRAAADMIRVCLDDLPVEQEIYLQGLSPEDGAELYELLAEVSWEDIYAMIFRVASRTGHVR